MEESHNIRKTTTFENIRNMKTTIKTQNMKKLLFLLLLFTGMVNAQIVNIPDANFKAKLLSASPSNTIAQNLSGSYFKIDANNDGEIQESEASQVRQLFTENSNISSLIGIKKFVNIVYLFCSNNQLNSLDISGLTNLFQCNCDFNLITSLNLNSLSSLQYLKCSNNLLPSLSLISLINLRYLYCENNQLTTLSVNSVFYLNILYCGNNLLSNLNVIGLDNLAFLHCNNNSLTNINLFGLISLQECDYSFNQITNINLSGLTNIINLNCSNNLLTNIDNASLNRIRILDCSFNQIPNLDISGSLSMLELNCSNNILTSLNVSLSTISKILCNNNQISSLNLTGLNNISELSCGNNLLQSLEVNGLTTLTELRCYDNQITTLDLTSLTNLGLLNCSNTLISNLNINSNQIYALFCNYNNLLTSIYMKNGRNELLSEFSNNPILEYICADETQLEDIQTKIISYGYANTCFVSSYCSFTPGGNFNTISGNIKYDGNNNGCDANDLTKSNVRVNISDGTNTGANFTNNTGNYTFYTQAGSFAITPVVENPTWFSFSPTTATIPFANNNNNTATQNFCITPNGIHPDLEVVLAPITPARPGFDATYELVYKNKGNQTLSGAVNLVFDDAKIDFVSAIPAVDNLAVNSLTWNYNNLLPFESRSIAVTLNVNSPVETPAVNIGDALNFTTAITPIAGDELPDDNTFTYNQTVVGSFDPNDITCLEGNSVAPTEIGKYLHYVINFENTGNFPAENVVVKTIIDPAKFDINSLQLLNTSNPVDARITGNVVEFIFEDIQLGGPGGHGHVLLKIKSKSNLVSGDNVAKSAGIYFDYNAPVDTGMATTVFQSLSNAIFDRDDSISVSPNPTSSKININSNFTIKSIELYDVQGRVLQTILNANKLDISEKTNGIYFLKITTEKGSKIEKVVKEY